MLNATTGARVWKTSTIGDCQGIGLVGSTTVAGYHRNVANTDHPVPVLRHAAGTVERTTDNVGSEDHRQPGERGRRQQRRTGHLRRPEHAHGSSWRRVHEPFQPQVVDRVQLLARLSSDDLAAAGRPGTRAPVRCLRAQWPTGTPRQPRRIVRAAATGLHGWPAGSDTRPVALTRQVRRPRRVRPALRRPSTRRRSGSGRPLETANAARSSSYSSRTCGQSVCA